MRKLWNVEKAQQAGASLICTTGENDCKISVIEQGSIRGGAAIANANVIKKAR